MLCFIKMCIILYFKMCIIVSCSARATCEAHSGGAGPGAPAHSQVDVDGHVQQRQAVAARAAAKRPEESSATGGAVGASPAERTWSPRWGVDVGPLRGRRSGDGFSAQDPLGQGRPESAGGTAGEGASSPDPVVLRSDRLWVVLGLGGGGKARGVSGLNGKSPTLRGLLGTHVQAPGRSAREGRSGRLGTAGRSLPASAPRAVPHLLEAEASPGLDAAA